MEEKIEKRTDQVEESSAWAQALQLQKQQNEDLRKENEKVKAELRTALDTFVNGQKVEEKKEESHRAPEEIRKELFDRKKPLNNLEYAKRAVELRKSCLAEGKEDPWVPSGHTPEGERFTPSQADYDAADRVQAVFEECIEYADGDSQLFTQELYRRTK